jgi:hypothetical protein
MDRNARSLLEAGLMATITAGEILERMKKNLGVPWQENSARDTYKAAALPRK